MSLWVCRPLLCSFVTESGVWLLDIHKPLNRPGWWKRKFISFQRPATRAKGNTCPGLSTLIVRGGKRFYRQREGATCINSTLSPDNHLQIGHQGSDLCHLDCFKYS